MPFPYVVLARLGAKPLEPFGKGSNALKAGTRDAGPSGPTERRKYWPARPSVQPPARVERKSRPYPRLPGKGKGSALAQWVVRRLDQFRKPHRQRDAFAHLLIARGCGGGGPALLLQSAKKGVET